MRFTINLYPDEREALVTLAQGERRDPRDQAALIIRQDLEKRGFLLAETDQGQPQPAKAGEAVQR